MKEENAQIRDYVLEKKLVKEKKAEEDKRLGRKEKLRGRQNNVALKMKNNCGTLVDLLKRTNFVQELKWKIPALGLY